MGYADNKHKMMGIGQQPIIADKVIDFLKNLDYKVTLEKSSLKEDIEDKIDYFIVFDESTPFGPEKLLQIAIDVKYGRSYTIENYAKKNKLEVTKADYIIYDPPYVISWDNETANLMWINFSKLKETVKKYPPEIYNSLYNDGSKFFWIYDYVKEHPEIVDEIS